MEVTDVIEGVAEYAGIPTTFGGGIKIAGLFLSSYAATMRKQRALTFIKCIDFQYDTLSPDSAQQIQAFIDSAEGQEILEQAIQAVIQSVSKVLPMAMALIVFDQIEYKIGKEQKINIINGIVGISDPLIDFYIELRENTNFIQVEPYPKYYFGSHFGLSGVFKKYKPEQIYSYIQQLINRSLILPNPQNESGRLHSGQGWSIAYGVSDEQRETMALFANAKAIVETQRG